MTRSLLLILLVSVVAFADPVCAQPVTVTDDLQVRVTLAAPARRVISLAPSITESLFAIGAGSRVVGVTDYCNYPEEARTRERVGGMVNPSLENLLRLKPDIVLVSMEGNIRDDYDRLRSMAVPVAVSNPRTLEGIYRSLQMLGTLTGCRAPADSLVRRLRGREQMLRASVDTTRVRVLMFVSVQPLIAVGGKTFLHELLVAAGGVNLAGAPSLTYPAYSREAVLEQDPDAMIITTDAIADSSAIIRLFPEWSHLRAVRGGRVHLVNTDLVSRPGPRALDGLQQLITFFHSSRL